MNAQIDQRPSPSAAAHAPACPVRAFPAALLALLLGGCTNQELPTYYGRHQIPAMSASVNGTDVLAGMFREAGHDVYYRRTLVTSELEAADTIVWFPDDYAAPTQELCAWFDEWLLEKPRRTLVCIGRDFDAAPLYWEHMKPLVGADQKRAYELRELDAKIDMRRPSNLDSDDLECEWFHFEDDASHDATDLAGPWTQGIDTEKTEIKLQTKLIPSRSVRRLLTSGGEVLASRFSRRNWEGSRILLVANGSFLLNLPLVNHEHRKLAGKLIAATGEPGRVVFLESGPGGPPIDPPYSDQSLWTLLGAWPLNVILLQLAAAGVIFCFARWPIFGRPQQPPAESTSDFGKHVEAVGQLLSRTKNRHFVLERVSHVDTSRSGKPRTPESPSRPGAPSQSGSALPPESEQGTRRR